MFQTNRVVVFRMRVERQDLSGVDPGELAGCVIESRAEGTIKSYTAALRRVWAFGAKVKKTVFLWREGEVCSFLMHLVHCKVGESVMKQGLAVVAMVFEAMGKSSPTKSPLVGQVKKTAVKKRSAGQLRSREIMSLRHLEVLIKNLFKKPASQVKPADRRCLVLQVLLFLGMKRFSDIQHVRVDDVKFRADGLVEVQLWKTKTDQEARGSTFVVVGDEKRGLLVAEVLKWYLESLGLEGQDYVFSSLRGNCRGEVKPVRGSVVSYGVALADLHVVCKRFGLPRLTLHSARIGAATAGAKAGVSRAYLQACGGWSSSAVDNYVRLRDPGAVFNRAIFRKV